MAEYKFSRNTDFIYYRQGRPGFLGIQYIGVFNFRYTVFLCLKLGIKYSLSINFGYLQINYYKNQECNHCFFFLLLLSFSLFFLFLLSSFFVAVILELLMLKKRAFWCLFTQITANFVTLVFKKLVRCISPLLPQFQVWPSKLKLFCLQSIDSERKPKEHAINHGQSGMWKTWSPGEILFQVESHFFCKWRVWMQVKVKNFPKLKGYISQNISSNSWNSIQGWPGGVWDTKIPEINLPIYQKLY